ncbi:aromatic ring-hydroxylating oxygenase subunit alpha [Ancylobacter lacus]|uniref:aromatic ring-hydroxylating oxygenase subunit alpha n=1 Tax=Ancylobacter lacus TaxID=2579970 RepID=UPI001BCD6F2B|nr:aromatic ring-hydroxylating dioxygenase subunit alpha [Ancylobacter lacus]MBS7540903.1 aromatic ring-hydroxylating dioxygenase subunit alpha [Ancylobacter lacus]
MTGTGSSTTLVPEPYVWTEPPLGDAKSAPTAFYTDPEVFRAEVQHIHLKTWFFAGRVEEVPQPGDYKALNTVGGPAILVRGEDGVLRAFANFCRHRASILLEGCGNANSIICPYHAWYYRLDGTLAGAPGMREVPKFEKPPHGLIPIRMEVWEGSVFLNYDENAPDLLTHLGNMPELLGSHRMGDMVRTWHVEIETKCNWKLLLENAMETYHTGIVHAATVGAQRSLSFPTVGEWHCIQVQANRSIAVLGQEPPFPVIEGLSEQSRKGTYFTLIEPTTQFACAQDCMWWLAVRPVAVDRSVLSVGGCFPRAYTELPDFAERAAPYYKRWEAVALEDVGILERQQVGLNSILARPGPLSWRDDMVLAMNRWVLARLPAHIRDGMGA